MPVPQLKEESWLLTVRPPEICRLQPQQNISKNNDEERTCISRARPLRRKWSLLPLAQAQAHYTHTHTHTSKNSVACVYSHPGRCRQFGADSVTVWGGPDHCKAGEGYQQVHSCFLVSLKLLLADCTTCSSNREGGGTGLRTKDGGLTNTFNLPWVG